MFPWTYQISWSICQFVVWKHFLQLFKIWLYIHSGARFGNSIKHPLLILLSFYFLFLGLTYTASFLPVLPVLSLLGHNASAMDFIIANWTIITTAISLFLFVQAVAWWYTENWRCAVKVISQSLKCWLAINLLLDLSKKMSVTVVPYTKETMHWRHRVQTCIKWLLQLEVKRRNVWR